MHILKQQIEHNDTSHTAIVILPNTEEDEHGLQKIVLGCKSDKDADAFVKGLADLLTKHTIEKVLSLT